MENVERVEKDWRRISSAKLSASGKFLADCCPYILCADGTNFCTRFCCRRFCTLTFSSRRCVFAFVAALRQFATDFVKIKILKC
nr:MAG TPA: hypothetical protein [Caudoviricetes sp.]